MRMCVFGYLSTIRLRFWFQTCAAALGGALEASAVADSVAYASDVEGEGDWDLSDLTGGPAFGHTTSIHVDYDHLWEVCSAASLSPAKYNVDLIFWLGVVLWLYPIVLLLISKLARLRQNWRPVTSVQVLSSRKSRLKISKLLRMWHRLMAQRGFLEQQRNGRCKCRRL